MHYDAIHNIVSRNVNPNSEINPSCTGSSAPPFSIKNSNIPKTVKPIGPSTANVTRAGLLNAFLHDHLISVLDS